MGTLWSQGWSKPKQVLTNEAPARSCAVEAAPEQPYCEQTCPQGRQAAWSCHCCVSCSKQGCEDEKGIFPKAQSKSAAAAAATLVYPRQAARGRE